MTSKSPRPVRLAQALAQVAGQVPAVGRGSTDDGGVSYRSYDDVVRALHGLMAEAGVSTVPVAERVVDRSVNGRVSHWVVEFRWLIVGPDGQSIEAVVLGEKRTDDDRGLSAARSVAHRELLSKLFLIPTNDRLHDSYQGTPGTVPARPRRSAPAPQPAVPADVARARLAEAAGGDMDLVDRLWKNRAAASERLLAAMCEQAAKEAAA